MNQLTRVFLVLLRLAIGWHFFFEGVVKIESVDLGPTQTNRPWTSMPYLQEATGPLAPIYQGLVGNPGDDALARLTVQPLAPSQDSGQTPLHTRFPAALARDWNDYFDAFARHYELQAAIQGNKPSQLELAKKKLLQNMDQTVQWLQKDSEKVTKSFPSGTVEVRMTTPERIAQFRQQLLHVRELAQVDMRAIGREAYKDQLRAAKDELRRLRAPLVRDLDLQTGEMKKALASILTSQQKALGPVPPSETSRAIDWIDWSTRWGLSIIGACLLLGLFSRLACLGGALFLLMIYLSMPPWPWLPPNPLAEGHYLFIDKNLIEMLALLCLATTRSGSWAGLDGLLQFLNPWRKGEAAM